jgi:hypothetical protein
MNPDSIVKSTKVPSTLVRPRYSQGLLLNDDDLTQAVDYTRDLNRLLFRSLLGYGVISGLLVKPSMPCGKLEITVEQGVALDCHGDALHLPTNCAIAVATACNTTTPLKTLWVVARRHQKYCAARAVVCAPDDDEAASAFTRIYDGVEIAVVKDWPACACGCKPPTQTQQPGDNDAKDAASDTAATAADNTPGKPAKARSARVENGGAAASTQTPTPTPGPAPVDPKCIAKASSPCDPCYKDHYAGIYDPCCAECGNASEWLMLAQLDIQTDGSWKADHVVRRFIRPLLMVDPQYVIDHPPQNP